VIAEPDLARRFRAQAAVYPALFRRITPLLLMLQGAAASQPDAAAMLAEFDERRLDAAAKSRWKRLPQASWRSVKTSVAMSCGRPWTAPCGIGWWTNAAGRTSDSRPGWPNYGSQDWLRSRPGDARGRLQAQRRGGRRIPAPKRCQRAVCGRAAPMVCR
jgi:hypothetical protein